MPELQSTITGPPFETRLPRHRHSAAAINKLGDQAVLSSLEELDKRVSANDARMLLDILTSDEKGGYMGTTEEDNFMVGLGIKVPTTLKFFVKNETYKKFSQNNRHGDGLPTIARFASSTETILVNQDEAIKSSLLGSLPKILYVHELAHASSHWGPFPKLDRKKQEVTYPNIRAGLSTQSEAKGEKVEHGVLLEEAFAHYVQAQYVKSKGLNFRNFIEGAPHNRNLQAVEIEDFFCAIIHPNSDLMTVSLKNRVKTMNSGAEKNQIILYPWYFIQGENPQDVGYNLQSILGMAFELIIEDDPSFFEALKSSRYETSGIREVRNKLNALRPGLYKRLRDLDYTPDGIFSFYHLVVNALDSKLSANSLG